jgi:histidine kinase
MKLSGLHIIDTIYESDKTIVSVAELDENKNKIIVKAHKKAFPTSEEIAALQHEYEICKKVIDEEFGNSLKFQQYENKFVFIRKYFEGVTLKEFIKNKRVSVKEFLEISLRLVEAVGKIHDKKLVHKDLNPNNIIIQPGTGEVSLIDFEISSEIDIQTQFKSNPNQLEGTILYISPEQTGRMNRIVDYRSDFYSLGVTFYEMLSGREIVNSYDPLEIIHFHIAKTPLSLWEIDPNIPQAICRIIEKLLSKNAEDRYQSAYGLIADLQHCKKQFDSIGTVEDFSIGNYDFSIKFSLSQKIYGRNDELKKLSNSYKNVLSGKKELVLIAGDAGVGKTALVYELHRELDLKKGFFIEGKFEKLNTDLPYFGWIRAFTSFLENVLSEEESDLLKWQIRLTEALGNSGKVLTDILPKLSLIIGDQPAVPELPPLESQNRIIYILKQFIKTIAQPNHPLVVFLDDLQWADFPSEYLFKLILQDKSIKNILIIASYRNNELNDEMPFGKFFRKLEFMDSYFSIDNGYDIARFKINNLSFQNLEAMVSDGLRCSIEKSKELTNVLYEKTGGNPFFASQFLKSLYSENLLTIDTLSDNILEGRWSWNIEKIKERNITDNVIVLMTQRFHQLPESTQLILSTAACIGNKFDLEQISVVIELGQAETSKALFGAIAEGFITPVSDNFKVAASEYVKDKVDSSYKFLHDKIHQGIYNLLSDKEKKITHLKLARQIIFTSDDIENSEKLFDLVNQYNQSLEIISDPNERKMVAKLNLHAGRKAMSSIAYDNAFNYFEIGISLCENDIVEDDYDLYLGLSLGIYESDYLRGNFSGSEKWFHEIISYAKDIKDIVKAYEIRIQTLKSNNLLKEAVLAGLEVLQLLNEKIPNEPTDFNILVAIIKLQFYQKNKNLSSLIGHKLISDPYKAYIEKIISIVTPASFFAVPKLLPLLVSKQTLLAMKYGHSQYSSYSYASYGLILCGFLNQLDRGYEYGKLSLDLLDKFGSKELESKLFFVFNTFIRHWKEPLNNCLTPLLRGSRSGMENGDYEFAGYNLVIYIAYSFYSGKNLSNLYKETEAFQQQLSQIRQPKQVEQGKVLFQFLHNIKSDELPDILCKGEIIDRNSALKFYEESNDKTGLFHLFLFEFFTAFLFNDFKAGINAIVGCERNIEGALSIASIPFYYFLLGLFILRHHNEKVYKYLPKDVKPDSLNEILSKFKNWSKHTENNYLHKFYLLKAEQFRVKKKQFLAREYYEKSIDSAREAGFLNDQALAYELSGYFYNEIENKSLAEYNINNAINAYKGWGANSKVKQLEDTFFHQETISNPFQKGAFSTSKQINENFDIVTIIKATQAISKEVVFSNLIGKLLNIILENTGAEKGAIFQIDQGDLKLSVLGLANGHYVYGNLIDQKFEDLVPVSTINYVKRTSQLLVLNKPNDSRYNSDNYIKLNKPQSLLCFPVVSKGRLKLIIYLENSLASGVFNSKRLELLNILSTQIAISVENAELYENLEEKVKLRTAEAVAQKELLEKKNKDVTSSINYAKRIQTAILPSEEQIIQYIPDSFIFLKPRDIVSGDFYWFFHDGGRSILATVDCTGHGVPGALMSIIGINLLNEIIIHRKIQSTSKILFELNKGVRLALKQEPNEIADGMDIAICIIDHDKSELEFAGAGLPLLIISPNEIIEIKGSKASVGGFLEHEVDYKEHKFKIEETCSVYMFTDGFQDQFGGRNGRKYMIKNLRTFLARNSNEPMKIQKLNIEGELNKWMEGFEQIDDILLIGFKFG